MNDRKKNTKNPNSNSEGFLCRVFFREYFGVHRFQRFVIKKFNEVVNGVLCIILSSALLRFSLRENSTFEHRYFLGGPIE